MELAAGGINVASYVLEPKLDRTLSPRPYLHPVRTLSGVVITDAEPEDHRWHLGLSLAMQDVNRSNLWGGRTYVRGQGYTWLQDHGTITHEGFDAKGAQHLAWRDHAGDLLLRERREIKASIVDGQSWRLDLSWELTAPGDRVIMGSPATNGRPDGAGYGGCFLRLAPSPTIEVMAGSLKGEEQVNGCAEPEVHWRTAQFEVTATGADRWFVRTGIYPGICAAWAFDEVRIIEAGQTWAGQFAMVVSDIC
jgi:hypothetical protein